MSTPGPAHRRGLAAGIGAYLLWGFLPLYFPLVGAASALEISAHRVVWSWAICMVLLLGFARFGEFRALLRDRARIVRLAAAAVLLSANWLVFVFAVVTNRVVEASLGYFINPLVTVILAMVFLREKVNRPQLVGLGIAAAGIVVLTLETGGLPWLSLVLACSFGFYGLMKKKVAPHVSAVAGFAAETTVVLPAALGYLTYLAVTGAGSFAVEVGPLGTRADFALLLVFSGVATTAPLLAFAAATRRIPLVTIGMIQFITPIMQFLTGVVIYREAMSPGRWVGFVCVWAALLVLSADALRKARSRPIPPAQASR